MVLGVGSSWSEQQRLWMKISALQENLFPYFPIYIDETASSADLLIHNKGSGTIFLGVGILTLLFWLYAEQYQLMPLLYCWLTSWWQSLPITTISRVPIFHLLEMFLYGKNCAPDMDFSHFFSFFGYENNSAIGYCIWKWTFQWYRSCLFICIQFP